MYTILEIPVSSISIDKMSDSHNNNNDQVIVLDNST